VHTLVICLEVNFIFQTLLDNIISRFQIAFVPNHHIQDNSILAHEMFHTLKSK
jgi:hypothetical protein